jgi:hypothetical protein
MYQPRPLFYPRYVFVVIEKYHKEDLTELFFKFSHYTVYALQQQYIRLKAELLDVPRPQTVGGAIVQTMANETQQVAKIDTQIKEEVLLQNTTMEREREHNTSQQKIV